MKKLKVVTVVGTRPEIIRLSRVIARAGRALRPRAGPHRPELRLRAERRSSSTTSACASPITSWTRRAHSAAQTIGKVIIAVDQRARRRAARRHAGARRHQQLPGGDPGQAPQDSDLPHGGRQSLLRPAGAGGDQPPHRRPHRRRQPDLQLDRPRVPAARGPAAGPGDQDRQSDVRGAVALSPADRRLGCADAASASSRSGTSSSARIARRTSSRTAHFAKLVDGAERRRGGLRPARDRLDPSAHAQAHRCDRRAHSTRRCGCSSRWASPTT